MIAEILIAILKAISTTGAPGAVIVLKPLADVGLMLMTIETDFSLTPEAKADLFESNARTLRETVAIAQEQGEILASEIPGILAQLAGAEIKSALGIHV